MGDIRFPLATSAWDDKELAAIDRVVKSGFYSMGREVAAFEKQFADMMGSRFALMVNSGSSANLLFTAALRYHSRHPLKPGDEIIVPAVSWSTSYAPLYQYGLRLKFVDINAETLNYDLDRLGEAVGSKTRAILVVNLLGNPNDFDAIERIIDGGDIIVLEDNCESLGAVYRGRQTGTFGLAGSYSAFVSHHISTMEGGVVVTDDEELHHIMLSLRAHGWTRNLPKENLVTGTKGDDPFFESFRFVLPGYNLRPLEMSGAIGQEQLRKLPAIVAGRRRNAETFKSIMDEFPQFAIQREIGESSWFGFSLTVRSGSNIDRRKVLEALDQAGIEYRPVVAGNFARNEVVEFMDHEIHGDLVNADHVDQCGLFIGNHHYELDREFDALRSALKKVCC